MSGLPASFTPSQLNTILPFLNCTLRRERPHVSPPPPRRKCLLWNHTHTSSTNFRPSEKTRKMSKKENTNRSCPYHVKLLISYNQWHLCLCVCVLYLFLFFSVLELHVFSFLIYNLTYNVNKINVY